MRQRRSIMGLLFYPRGGSAYVVRYLSPALARTGRRVSIVAGSLGAPGDETHATTFFEGLDTYPVDYSSSADAFDAGADPMAADPPMQPSYEDRAGVPDVVLASVDPALADHLADAWTAPLGRAGADDTDVFHLHHLTPQLDSAHAHWPRVPIVVHLHGTEMKLLDGIAARMELAARLGETLTTMPDRDPDRPVLDASDLDARQFDLLGSTRWGAWRHGEFWADRLRGQIALADHVITVSPQNRAAAVDRFALDPANVTTITNGVDIDRFAPTTHTPASRRAVFCRALVKDPQGWTENGGPGTLGYDEDDIDRLVGADGAATVLLFVGRFLAFKRVPLLIRAFARARDRFERPGSLIVWGGHPGEWEGEHPVTVARDVGDDGIFFVGWRGHHDLPEGLAACDALVVPSVADPFPQVPLEAMAVGLPVLAANSGGLMSMVNLDPTRPTGWLVPPDDLEALADRIVDVVNHPDEVRVRGTNALAHARAELSWDGLVPAFEQVYEQAAAHHANRGRPRPV